MSLLESYCHIETLCDTGLPMWHREPHGNRRSCSTNSRRERSSRKRSGFVHSSRIEIGRDQKPTGALRVDTSYKAQRPPYVDRQGNQRGARLGDVG